MLERDAGGSREDVSGRKIAHAREMRARGAAAPWLLALVLLAHCTSAPSDGGADAADATLDTLRDAGFLGYDIPPFDVTPTCLAEAGTIAAPPDAGFAITEIVAGERHTCALLGDGTARCWGHNAFGELGDGTTTSRTHPTPVPGLAHIRALAAGGRHTCAVLDDGTAQCWGENLSGQIGDGTSGTPTPRLTPTPVRLPSGMHAVTIAAGENTSCITTADGHGVCWGRNDEGELALGNTNPFTGVLVATGQATNIDAFAPGSFDTCASLRDGRTVCLGANAEGQDGDCHGLSSTTFTTVVTGQAPTPTAPFLGLHHVAMSLALACAIDGAGRVQCWGTGVHCQLARQPGMTGPLVRGLCSDPMGYGNNYFSPLPIDVPPAIDLAVSALNACAVLVDGTIRCWGANQYGQLATCDPGDHCSSELVIGLAGVAQVALGIAHGCARVGTTAVYCWGDNEDGRLGDGSTASRATPEPVLW